MLWQVVQQRRLAFRLEHVARRLKQTLVTVVVPRTSPQSRSKTQIGAQQRKR
jgi:hypothetical protein